MFRRLKNLWGWSDQNPPKKKPFDFLADISNDQSPFNPKNKRLATVVEDKPDIFPDEPKTD